MCYLCEQIKVARGVAKLDASLNSIEGIDEEIVYRDFSNTGSPYTYILKIWELNKDRLCGMFQLLRMMVNHEQQTFHIHAAQASQVRDALHCVTDMLHRPILSFCVDPNEVIAMRILKAVKKEFSNQTGCWLHFKWPTRTVSVYGLDADAANQFVGNVMEQLRGSLSSGGPNVDGLTITEQVYDRRFKTLIKKYVGYIETQSGAQLVIKKDDPTFGQIIVQFYGIQANIQRAQEVINEEVLVRPVDEAGPCPAKACSPGEILPPDQFQSRLAQQGKQPPRRQNQPNTNFVDPSRQPRQQRVSVQPPASPMVMPQNQQPVLSWQQQQLLQQQQQSQQQQQLLNPFTQQPLPKQPTTPQLLPFQQLQPQAAQLAALQSQPQVPQQLTMPQLQAATQQQQLQQMQQQMQQQIQQQVIHQGLQKLQQTFQPMQTMQPAPQVSSPQPVFVAQPIGQQPSTQPSAGMPDQQMVYVNVNGVPYPVMVLSPEQKSSAEPQGQYSSLRFQATPVSAASEAPASKSNRTSSQCSSPRADESDSPLDHELQGMLSNQYPSMDRQMLLQMARMRGPKMQLFNSCSMPNLPLTKQKEATVASDTFSNLEEEEYNDLMKQTQQQMKNIYQVVNGAGVDLKWVILLLKEIGKSKLELRTVIEMLENASAIRQFEEFTTEDNEDD